MTNLDAFDYDGHLSKLPGLDDPEQHDKSVKLFTPDAGASWFLVAYDPEEKLGFGLAYLGPHMADFAELGYVSIDELSQFSGPLSLRVEVDLHWNGSLADGYEQVGLPVPDYAR